MSQRKFIIDADTGSDDAVAILMALREPTIDVLGITLVSGNVPRDQGIINTLSQLLSFVKKPQKYTQVQTNL
jgi:purine nucleosidase